MKKIILSLVIIVVFGMLVGFNTANAQADSTEVAPVIVSTGVRPVGFFDKVKLFLTFNKEKKANLLQDYSNREFELAKEKLEAGSTDEAGELFEKSEDYTTQATDSTSKIQDQKKQEEILNSIGATASNRTVILKTVQAKVENLQAKEAIQRALDKQEEVKLSADEKIKSLLSKISQLEAKVVELEKKNSASQEKSEKAVSPVSKNTDSSGNIKIEEEKKEQEEKKEDVNNSTSDWYEDNAWRAPPGGWNKEPVEEKPIVCDPTIRIISPNGGEVYQPGEKITVTWESSCMQSAGIDIGLHFADGLELNDPYGGFPALAWVTSNDGTETVFLPDITSWDNGMEFGRHYKIQVIKHAINVPNLPSDASDDLFTIEE